MSQKLWELKNSVDFVISLSKNEIILYKYILPQMRIPTEDWVKLLSFFADCLFFIIQM
jgi:hypothetical protein